jgi:hypothetical protein
MGEACAPNPWRFFNLKQTNKMDNEIHNGSKGAWINADVLYSKHLNTQQKILYAVIFNLTHKNGFCWASNNYFANELNVSIRTIQRDIDKLIKHGFLNRVDELTARGKETKRLLYVMDAPIAIKPATGKQTTPHAKNGAPPHVTFGTPPHAKNGTHNKQVINKTSKEIKNITKNVLFDAFWEMYPNKVGKGKAMSTWQKVMREEKNIMDALPRHVAQWVALGTEKKYIPHPATWLNQQRWLDEVPELKTTHAHAPRQPKDFYYFDEWVEYCKQTNQMQWATEAYYFSNGLNK